MVQAWNPEGLHISNYDAFPRNYRYNSYSNVFFSNVGEGHRTELMTSFNEHFRHQRAFKRSFIFYSNIKEHNNDNLHTNHPIC